MNFDHLYKFHKVTKASKGALASNSIWLSKQESLNDPFEGIAKTILPECSDKLITKSIQFMTEMLSEEEGLAPAEAKNIVLESYIENPEYFLSTVREQAEIEHYASIDEVKTMGIYSTSSDIPGDERTHVENMIMWSLYADGFKGFCIKYNAKELYNSLKDLNPDDNFAYTKVNYVTKPHEIDLFSFVHRSNFDYIKALQNKHSQWSHECECRILCSRTGLKEISRNSIEAIYVGEKIELEDELAIIEIANQAYPNIDIFKVKIDKETYGIRIGKKL